MNWVYLAKMNQMTLNENNMMTLNDNNMMSNCCGAEPSYLSDELCGACLEHSLFTETEE